MLIIRGKAGQEIRCGPDIKIKVLRVRDRNVELGIEVPENVQIEYKKNDEQKEGQSWLR